MNEKLFLTPLAMVIALTVIAAICVQHAVLFFLGIGWKMKPRVMVVLIKSIPILRWKNRSYSGLT